MRHPGLAHREAVLQLGLLSGFLLVCNQYPDVYNAIQDGNRRGELELELRSCRTRVPHGPCMEESSDASSDV